MGFATNCVADPFLLLAENEKDLIVLSFGPSPVPNFPETGLRSLAGVIGRLFATADRVIDLSRLVRLCVGGERRCIPFDRAAAGLWVAFLYRLKFDKNWK